MAAAPTISIIVPVWNDAEAWRDLWPQLQALEPAPEIIVASAGESFLISENVKVVPCPEPNRGAQMNLGAAAATGNVLLFHHADSQLTPAHFAALRQAMSEPRNLGGAFHRVFDQRHAWLRWLVEPIGRAALQNGGSFFGDQSIFVRRETFQSLGGYAAIPLMEDLEFSRRLRRLGRTVVLDPPMISSDRRHRARGTWRTSIQNALFITLYRLGVSPHRLHAWYYGPRRG